MNVLSARVAAATRNGMPPSRSYRYRGSRREGLPDLETVNAAIIASRDGGQPKRPGPPRSAECGTSAGFIRHRRLRERPCDDCRNAHQREDTP